MIPPHNYREHRQTEGRAFQHPVRATIIGITLTLIGTSILAPSNQQLHNSNPPFATYIALALLTLVYFLPTIIARRRRLPTRNSILVLNTTLGWLIIPWIVCLAMSVARAPTTRPR